MELAVLAALYADRIRSGSRSPNKEVADFLGDGWTPAQVRDAKFLAADKGFLCGTEARKAAGVLTRKAVLILEQTAKEKP